MEVRTLSDGTVWLSPPTEADIDTITECCQDPEIGAWVTTPVPYLRSDAEIFITDIVGPGWAGRSPTWALRLRADGPTVGMIGLGEIDLSAAEIGFWTDARARGRGLMSRAIRLVCDYGFRTDGMALSRISWRAFIGNHASAAVVRRNGFRYEGLARLGSVQRGIRRDNWVAARLATDPPDPADGWPSGV